MTISEIFEYNSLNHSKLCFLKHVKGRKFSVMGNFKCLEDCKLPIKRGNLTCVFILSICIKNMHLRKEKNGDPLIPLIFHFIFNAFLPCHHNYSINSKTNGILKIKKTSCFYYLLFNYLTLLTLYNVRLKFY